MDSPGCPRSRSTSGSAIALGGDACAGVGSGRGVARFPSSSAAQPLSERPIRAAEVVGALSLATDLGTGQPLEHAMRTAVLAVRLGELAGASAKELSDAYYVALLHASGCTSNGHEATQLYGDDIAHRAAFYLIDPTNPRRSSRSTKRTSGSAAAPRSARS